MKSSIFTSVVCFENRYLYIMAADCLTIEVLDTHDLSQKFCHLIQLKMDFVVEDLMRPVMMSLDQDEICYLQSQQESESD
jgi:hypothetical protein